MFLQFSSFLALLSAITLVAGQFDRDYVSNIRSVGQSISINYPGANPAGSSCRYQIIAPVNSIIEASCSFTVQDSSPCLKQKFSVSRSGDKPMRDANSYCGRGSILMRSIGNEIFVAMSSTSSVAASFQCVFKSIAPSNSDCDCGWNVKTRIVGGGETGVNQFVSHAGLVDRQTRDVFCAAIIVTQEFVLTAAHCLEAFPIVANTAVLAGDHDLKLGSDTIWSAAYLVERYIKHSGFNGETNANDIALVKVSGYIRFNRGVGPACMPYTFMQNDAFFDGKSLTVVGWGALEYGAPGSNVLKAAQVQVVSLSTCSKQNQNINSTKVCTAESKSGSSCTRDSGGGLYWIPSRQYAIGIVSYGTFCASNVPSVNTRITSYIGWIEANVKTFLCRKT